MRSAREVSGAPPAPRRRGRRFWITAFVAFLAVAAAVFFGLRSSLEVLRPDARAPMPDEPPVSELGRVCASPIIHGFCGDPSQIAHDLARASIDVVESHVTSEGATRPERLRVEVARPEGKVTYHVKWKAVPPELDRSNHSPRREIASYQIQSLLFAPEHFVVPPTAIRCLPLHRRTPLVADTRRPRLSDDGGAAPPRRSRDLSADHPSAPFDGQEHAGVRRRGADLQLGLSRDEVDDVYERLQELLATIDDNAIRTI